MLAPALPPWAEFPRYETLTWEFVRLGKLERQIEAIYRDRSNPQRVRDFRTAVADGAIRIEATDGLKLSHLKRLVELGVDVPPVVAREVISRKT